MAKAQESKDQKATGSAARQEDQYPADARTRNFDQARETARINHENGVKQNTVSGNEGVQVRDAQPKEVINPVRNPATGELEDDTRTLKQTPEEAVGAEEDKSAERASNDESK